MGKKTFNVELTLDEIMHLRRLMTLDLTLNPREYGAVWGVGSAEDYPEWKKELSLRLMVGYNTLMGSS